MPASPQRVAVIIEDDIDISNLLEAVLGQAGFETYAFDDGEQGVKAVREYQPILTTLDVNLPGIDGFEVARRIRSFSATYIIMLTALNDEIDTLMGLDAGADDYLTKPFRHRELRARVEAMLRRSNAGQLITEASAAPISAANIQTPQSPSSEPSAQEVGGPAEPDPDTEQWIEHNGLRLSSGMRLCELDGEPVSLTRSEFDLLKLIMNGKRRVVTKDDLILELRGDGATGGVVMDGDRRALEVHLANLRRKLSDSARDPRFIETVRGVGYRLAVARS